MNDQIDQAIAAAAAAPDFTGHTEVPVLIATTGRPVVLLVPADLSDAELIELTAWMLLPAGGLKDRLAAARGPKSRIVIPNRIANA